MHHAEAGDGRAIEGEAALVAGAVGVCRGLGHAAREGSAGKFIAPLLAPMRGRHMGGDRSIQLPKRGIWGEGQANRGK